MSRKTTESIDRRFQVVRKLGSGAMGRIDMARDSELGRQVAVKRILAGKADEDFRKRFLQEARVTARLNHPNIVRLLDFGVTDVGELFIVYELLEGKTLEELADTPGQAPDSARLAELGAQLADALAHAHENRILHRDVKPANVFVREDGTPVLCDFGLAKDHAPGGMETATGQVLGTPAYLDPCIFQRQAVSPRSDQYALAVTLFKARTGDYPYPMDEIMEMIRTGKLAALQLPDYPPGADRDLLEALKPALRPDPGDRYPDMGAFAERLRSIAAGRAPEPGPAPATATATATVRRAAVRAEPPARRRRFPLGPLLGVTLTAGLAAYWTAGRPAGPPAASPLPSPSAAPTPEVDTELQRLEETMLRAEAQLGKWSAGADFGPTRHPMRISRHAYRTSYPLFAPTSDRQLDIDLEDWTDATATWLHAIRRDRNRSLSDEEIERFSLGDAWRTVRVLRSFETLGTQHTVSGFLDPKITGYVRSTTGRWPRIRAALARVAEVLASPPPGTLEEGAALCRFSSMSHSEGFLLARRELLARLEQTPDLGLAEVRALGDVLSGVDLPIFAGPATCDERGALVTRAWRLLVARGCLEESGKACIEGLQSWNIAVFRLGHTCDQAALEGRRDRLEELRNAMRGWPAADVAFSHEGLEWFLELYTRSISEERQDLRDHLAALGEMVR